MIFYACVKYDEHQPQTYKGIEVSMLGISSDIVATFESYDPLEDFRNFVSWSEGVGEDNVGYCDSLKHFAKDYSAVSEDASKIMLSMIYGQHQDCANSYS
ncbi:hypothetical protein SM124_07665 [Bacillus sp. 31A1R]|uniref:Uncharacterized protein n=1 Tax=Robertmurraya mangrovi TaxID=3098077 RepID=A0ABU5IWV4_9BACI|nr:hypothetical protein [Bacillus sp. 31A1R]MDZ5471624.1 hypothetical protein [Bacillus sp. 31A1R]